ncbi:MAG: hypothetical protein J0M24_13945 [Verrucomicrobia bacterium]|nr:hypothetical protein [Verrucomicrobiota bacterium]
MTATLAQIRELQGLVAKANAALTPLAADGEGRDCHGGTIRNPDVNADSPTTPAVQAALICVNALKGAAEEQ